MSAPPPATRRRPFSEAADEYLQRLRDTDGKNLKPKAQHLNNHLKPFFKARRLDDFTNFNIRQYLKARATAGASTAKVNCEMETLRHMLKTTAS